MYTSCDGVLSDNRDAGNGNGNEPTKSRVKTKTRN
jgi:hypothetical protein